MRVTSRLRTAAPATLALLASHSQAEGLAMVGPSDGTLFWVLLFPLGISCLFAVAMLFRWSSFTMLLRIAVYSAIWLLAGVISLNAGIGFVMLLFFPWFLCISLVVGWSKIPSREDTFDSEQHGSASTTSPEVEQELSTLVTALQERGFTVRRTAPLQWAVSKPDSSLVVYYNSVEEISAFARKCCNLGHT